MQLFREHSSFSYKQISNKKHCFKEFVCNHFRQGGKPHERNSGDFFNDAGEERGGRGIQQKSLTAQKNSRRLWRSQRRKSRSVPEGGADFPAAIFLPGNAQTLAGIAFRAAGKAVQNFPAASKFAEKPFQHWPRGSTGVQRYGCILRTAADNLGEIPKILGAPNLLF